MNVSNMLKNESWDETFPRKDINQCYYSFLNTS